MCHPSVITLVKSEKTWNKTDRVIARLIRRLDPLVYFNTLSTTNSSILDAAFNSAYIRLQLELQVPPQKVTSLERMAPSNRGAAQRRGARTIEISSQ